MTKFYGVTATFDLGGDIEEVHVGYFGEEEANQAIKELMDNKDILMGDLIEVDIYEIPTNNFNINEFIGEPIIEEEEIIKPTEIKTYINSNDSNEIKSLPDWGREDGSTHIQEIEITAKKTDNINKPISLMRTVLLKDGEEFVSGWAQYKPKQDKDGRWYIKYNIGVGYYKVRVDITDLMG